ncbi:P-loop containing nucleoside triphosphate hydrolase protein, partial [Setomelanomma holmii]
MIVVMGVTGAGKSYFINQLAGKEVVQEGSSLDSCTQECQLVPVSIGSSKVLLIDTPGFDDTQRTDSQILTEIARILSAQYELGVQLKGVIYIHRITDIRYSRSSVKTFEIFRKICGETALENVLLVTSRWHEIDGSTGADRERQLKDKFWVYMLGHGSNISRFHGDRPSAVSLVSQLLCKDTVVLQLQKELVDEGKNLDDTVAGSYVSDSLEKLKKQYQDELISLERLKLDLLENDRAMKRQHQRDWERESAHLRQAQNDQVSLQRPVGTEVRQE